MDEARCEAVRPLSLSSISFCVFTDMRSKLILNLELRRTRECCGAPGCDNDCAPGGDVVVVVVIVVGCLSLPFNDAWYCCSWLAAEERRWSADEGMDELLNSS